MSLQLFEKFVEAEGLLNYLDELYNDLYTYVVKNFDREVRANVYYDAHDDGHSVSIEGFYRFNRDYAVEAWLSFVITWIDALIIDEGYKSKCAVVTVEKIDTLIDRFIGWLRTLDHDELDAELAIKLLTGDVSDRDVALNVLCAYLRTHCAWYYPI